MALSIDERIKRSGVVEYSNWKPIVYPASIGQTSEEIGLVYSIRMSDTEIADFIVASNTFIVPDGNAKLIDGSGTCYEMSRGTLTYVPPGTYKMHFMDCDEPGVASKYFFRFFDVKWLAAKTEHPLTHFKRPHLCLFESEAIIITEGVTTQIFPGEISFAENFTMPGVRTTEHDIGVHEYYLFFGKGQVYIDGKIHDVDRGSFAIIPTRCKMGIINNTDQALRMVCICTPPFELSQWAPVAGSNLRHVPEGLDIQGWWDANKDALLA